MIVDVNKAEGVVLDWLVAKALGIKVRPDRDTPTITILDVTAGEMRDLGGTWVWSPTTNWSQAGPIIEANAISLNFDNDPGYLWAAWTPAPLRDEAEAFGYGNAMLIAAMRCYVASELGDQVEVPEELCTG